MEAVSANVIAKFRTTVCAYLIFDNAPSHWNVEEATATGILSNQTFAQTVALSESI